MFRTKYMRTKDNEIIVFGEIMQHSDFRNFNPVSAGFIPCKKHAEQILNNEITIDSLISKNRNKMFPKFPNA